MSKSSLMLAAAIADSVAAPIARAAETPIRIVEVTAERGSRVAFADGRVLKGEDLKGATITIAGLKDLKVADVEVDRLRLRGPNGARDKFHRAAAAQNFRRLARLLPNGPQMRGA